MAYAVSQLRKVATQDSVNTYMTPLTRLIQTTDISPNNFGETDNTFLDYAIRRPTVSNGDEKFQAGKVYYLRFKVHKIPQFFYSGSKGAALVEGYMGSSDMLTVNLFLKDSEALEDESPPEQIGTFTVYTESDINVTNSYSSYSFIFCPTKTFDTLVFRISRVGFDAIEYDDQDAYGNNDRGYRNWFIDQLDENYTDEMTSYSRYDNNGDLKEIKIEGKRIVVDLNQEGVEVNDADFCELNNLLLQSKNRSSWLKFGYQSRPGNLIVVNNEPIIVGRSGIYEIDNGTKITSFMIACPNGNIDKNIDAFLLDYAYISS